MYESVIFAMYDQQHDHHAVHTFFTLAMNPFVWKDTFTMLFSKEPYLHPHAEVAISTVTAATADVFSLSILLSASHVISSLLSSNTFGWVPIWRIALRNVCHILFQVTLLLCRTNEYTAAAHRAEWVDTVTTTCIVGAHCYHSVQSGCALLPQRAECVRTVTTACRVCA